MKRGTKFFLPVDFDFNLDAVDYIEFYLKQSINTMEYTYPSDTAVRDGENRVNLTFERKQTYIFKADKPIELDTRIHLKDVETNPKTNIVSFVLSRTLFPADEG